MDGPAGRSGGRGFGDATGQVGGRDGGGGHAEALDRAQGAADDEPHGQRREQQGDQESDEQVVDELLVDGAEQPGSAFKLPEPPPARWTRWVCSHAAR